MKKSYNSLASIATLYFAFITGFLVPFTARADIVFFNSSLAVTVTPQPAPNALDFLPNTCEVQPGGLIVDTSILSTAYCNTGVLTYSSFTVANHAIHAGNVAASSSSQAHAYIMKAGASPFTLNGISLKSYATRTDMKVSQWYVYAVKADGTAISYQAPVSATGFSFTDMTNVVYVHIFSSRGAFDLYNVDATL